MLSGMKQSQTERSAPMNAIKYRHFIFIRRSSATLRSGQNDVCF